MRRGTVLLAVGLVVALSALALGAGAVQPDRSPRGDRTAETVKMVTVEENGTARLWPYTSRRKEFSAATLPINVVVDADAGTTRRVLAGTERWNASNPRGEGLVVNGTGVAWSQTEGAERYTYVETASGGTWKTATYQLHDGTYLGSRTHLRLYEGGGSEETWTAIQGHTEYWDWFRLRHTVDSVAAAQYAVEHDLYGTGLIAEVSRVRYGNGGALDADGWVTHIDMVDWMVRPSGPTGTTGGTEGTTRPAVATLLASLALGTAMAVEELTPLRQGLVRTVGGSRVTGFHLALGLATAFALPTVRLTSIYLEGALVGVPPKLIAAPMYLALVHGLPAAAGAFGSRVAANDGFLVAFLGLGVGFVLDYVIVGVTAVPIHVLVQRAVLLVGLGLIAAGGTRWSIDPLRRNRYRIPGVVLWVVGLLWPLLDLV